jgi:hypothetical protein
LHKPIHIGYFQLLRMQRMAERTSSKPRTITARSVGRAGD